MGSLCPLVLRLGDMTRDGLASVVPNKTLPSTWIGLSIRACRSRPVIRSSPLKTVRKAISISSHASLLSDPVGLNLNIWVPTGTDPTAHLPVAVVGRSPDFTSRLSADSPGCSGYLAASLVHWFVCVLVVNKLIMQVHLRSARLKGPWRTYKHPRLLTHLGVLVHSLNGSVIVTRSIEMEEPVIYVSMNYR